MAQNTNSVVDDDLDLTGVFKIRYYDFNWLVSDKDKRSLLPRGAKVHPLFSWGDEYFHTVADTYFNDTLIKWEFCLKERFEDYLYYGFEARLISNMQKPLPARIEATILPKGPTEERRSGYRAIVTDNFQLGVCVVGEFMEAGRFVFPCDIEKDIVNSVVAIKVQVINFRVIDDDLRLSRLFKDEPTPNRLTMDIKKLPEDVVIRCNKKEFKAHKFLLTARSKVFRKMFSNNMKESRENTIEIQDIEPRVVEEMLNYMYMDTVKFQDRSDLTKLIHAAHKYQLDHLELLCQNKLLKTLDLKSSVELLMLSDKYDLKMKKYVIMYMAAHAEKISEMDEWKKLKVEKCDLAVEVSEKAMKMIPLQLCSRQKT